MCVWFQKYKVSIPATKVIKIPTQREKMMKVLNPTPKKVTFEESQEKITPTNKDYFVDLLVILQTKEQGREGHHPFYISLLMNNLLIHNCMLDSGSSSNITTKKVMEQLNLKITRPYHNVCAMDSREVEVVGIIFGFSSQIG